MNNMVEGIYFPKLIPLCLYLSLWKGLHVDTWRAQEPNEGAHRDV